MIRRTKKHLSPGLVLSLIALVVAVGGTAIAQNAGDNTLRTRLGGATQQVVESVTLLPQSDNNGVSDHLVTCPSHPKLGAGVAIGGGVIDPRSPDNTRNLSALAEKTDGPSGISAWLFEFDNDTAVELPVQLRVLCTFSKLNTKRG
ncbi:MAG: hypothetical protein K0S15_38 [Solirubrobacterales bacterium]|jgi:hypothetical protein|nr:hypothetical protein [Solirubrobacterales bacterium]